MGNAPDHVGRRPVYRLYKFVWIGLDWLYPPICGGCEKAHSHWCQKCQNATRLIPNSVCLRCGQILGSARLCSNCREHPPSFKALRSWAVFSGPLRKALHRLKYEKNIGLGFVYSQPLIKFFETLGWEVDLVTPVPMGIASRRQRGYNQASVLAFPLALGIQKPFKPRALRKIRETTSQVNLSYEQRLINVIGAFQSNEKFVRGKSVLIVDDVTTSGATMEACASALNDAGARKVYGLTLARTI